MTEKKHQIKIWLEQLDPATKGFIAASVVIIGLLLVVSFCFRRRVRRIMGQLAAIEEGRGENKQTRID